MHTILSGCKRAFTIQRFLTIHLPHTSRLTMATTTKTSSTTAARYVATVTESKNPSPSPADAKDLKHHAPKGGFENPWLSWSPQAPHQIMLAITK
jgi:hypothetical protein